MSPVRRQRLELRDLVSRILGVSGKNPARISTVLARGSLVSSNIRYRWSPIKASATELATLLDGFPDHDPQRSFDARLCRWMTVGGPHGDLEITREAGQRKRLFHKKSFWEEALRLVSPLSPRCVRYSYTDQVDVFSVRVPRNAVRQLRILGKLLRYSSLRAQIQALQTTEITLYVSRS